MRALRPKMISPLSPKRAAPASLTPSSVESAIAQNPSPFVRLSVSAPREVRIHVNIFWSLSGTAVYSVNAGQTPAEVNSGAAKKLRELGVATRFVFSRASAPNGYLNNYSAAYPPRADAPLCSSI
jgi:hypothetical protein